MPSFGFHLPPDLFERFDALAAAEGGRSKVLRRLVDGYLAEEGDAELVDRVAWRTRGKSSKLTVRLRVDDLARLDVVSREAGFTRTGWLAALTRARLADRPVLNAEDAEAYRRATRELHRIGVNLNQIARAMNTAVLDGTVLNAELHIVEGARVEIREIAAELREALNNNRRYWRGEG